MSHLVQTLMCHLGQSLLIQMVQLLLFHPRNNQHLDIQKNISYPSRKYGRWIPKKSQSFVWCEDLDYFLEVCGERITSFIDDCKEDTIEDLDYLKLDYLYKLNFPSANILAKKTPYRILSLSI